MINSFVLQLAHKQSFLQNSNPYEKWAQWCEQVVAVCLRDDATAQDAKQFFLTWEFYRFVDFFRSFKLIFIFSWFDMKLLANS